MAHFRLGLPAASRGRLRAWSVAVCVCCLAGCTTRRPDGRTVLKFSIWGTPSQIEVEETVVRAFERSHPFLAVEIIHIPRRYSDKLMTMIVGKTAPDVMMMEITPYAMFASKGVLVDLDGLIKRDRVDLSDVYPLALNAFRYQGSLYCLPRDVSGMVMFYNKTMFEHAGVALPTAEWTWQDFAAACKKLTADTDGDGIVDRYGAILNDFNMLVWAFGGEVFDDRYAPTACTIDSRRAIEALRFVADLFKQKVVAPPEVTADQGYFQMFETGRVGMYFTGRWLTPNFKRIRSFRWDVVSVPKGRRRATRHGGTAYAISSSSAHIAEAWEFLKFYAGPEGVRLALDGGRTTPVFKSIANSPEFLGQHPPTNMPAFVQTMLYGQRECYIPDNALVADVLRRHYELLMLGQRSPRLCADSIKKELTQLLHLRPGR